MKIWLAIVLGSALSIVALWCTSIPLGIPGEWTWERAGFEPDLLWNLSGGLVAAAMFMAFVMQGWRRLEGFSNERGHRRELAAWLAGLVAISFTWLWIVQEVAPIKSRLGKSAFVLYFTSSSGYFTRSRYDEPKAAGLLAGYEALMRQGDVLHTGTHPPGLFLVFHGLIAACESSPELSALLDATQPASFREACDVIASNSLRRRIPVPLLPLDRRVLWLATLLVMLSASLTVVPLYALLRPTTSMPTAWICSALWPAMPAVAIFIPKSDVVFPLIGLTLLWLWLTAWDRRSPALALLAGCVAWCGLLCSLAFLPVLLAAAMLTLGLILISPKGNVDPALAIRPLSLFQGRVGGHRWLCIVAAALGFAVPTFLLWRFAQINLLNVWWWNYRNHAGFYEHYPRTYWKWLLVNPLEVASAAGWPITMLAIVTCCGVMLQWCRRGRSIERPNITTVIGPLVFVWGLLWLTGKNSGEAARIWILFLPWLIWLGSIQFESISERNSNFKVRRRQVIALLAIQFAVCLLTVARVSGFQLETG